MSNEEQHERVMDWARKVIAQPEDYTTHGHQRAAVLLAQEAELATQRKLLERCYPCLMSKSKIARAVRAHLDGAVEDPLGAEFWDKQAEMENMLDELEPLHPSLADSAASDSEITDEIVAAIAELDWHLRHKGDLMNNLNDKIGRYKRDAAAQISAQADKQDEMQVAIDQIRSVQDAANGIYYEIQRDDIRPMQERLDALEGNVKSVNGEVSRLFNGRVDKADKRLDALAEALLKLNDVLSGTGNDVECAEAMGKLREMKGGE